MKKIPFYNPASPLFFHIAVLLLYVLIFLLTLVFYGIFSIPLAILIFSFLYPFFALAMAVIIKKAYINTYQVPASEEFADKLALYNRYLISVIYILPYVAGYVAGSLFLEGEVGLVFGVWFYGSLLISVPCFLFYLFVPPKLIRFILLKKWRIKSDVIMSGIIFLSFLITLLILLFLIFD